MLDQDYYLRATPEQVQATVDVYDADYECDHLNLPTPKYPFPDCGCWPTSADEREEIRESLPDVLRLFPVRRRQRTIEEYRQDRAARRRRDRVAA